MTGKAPPSRSRKDRARTARPYDRPNQSILGKVASTVKGLFTPSWLFNVSSWVRTNTEDNTVNSENIIEPDLTENEDEPEAVSVKQRPSGRFKRPRTDCGPSAINTTETPYWLGPSTSRDNLLQNVDRPSATSTNIPDCEPVRKETPITINGDDHSENSDASASTSGCSSLVSSQDKPHRSSGLKLSESALELLRGELKGNPIFQRQRKEAATLTTNDIFNSPRNTSQGNVSLWSCGTQTPAKSPQIPSCLNSSRPSFNVSSFGGVSKTNSPASKTASPFYDGNTTFGGASAYRRRQLNSTPYQLNQSAKAMRCQVKVSSSNKELECMSTAAKRILHTLETMSTPITDAKKIPNVAKSPLDIPSTIMPPNRRLKSYLPLSRNSPASTPKGPPIVNLNAVTKLSLLKNQRGRMRNSLMELPLTEQPMVTLPAECTITKSQDSSDISSRIDGNSCSNVITSSGGSGGGKMRTKLREPLHTSSKAKLAEEPMPEYDLPSVPLPVSSNLPAFKFTSKNIPETSTSRTTESKKEARIEQISSANENNVIPFTFSSPIEYIPPGIKAQDVAKGDLFKFSSPLVVSPKTIAAKKKEESTEIYSDRSINDILKKLRDKSNDEGDKEDSTKQKKMDTSNQVKGFGDKFKPKAGSWSCTACFVQNDECRESCISCSTAKCSQSGSPKTFKNTAASSSGAKKTLHWECASCNTKNECSASKCSVCKLPNNAFALKNDSSGLFVKKKSEETPPGPAGKKSKPSIANDISASLKSSSNMVTASAFGGKLFQNNANTWECDACMVRNTLDKIKCLACETLRPSKEKDAATKFTFGASRIAAPSFAVDSTTVEASKTSAAESSSDYQKPSFTFGAPLKVDVKPSTEASSQSQPISSQSTAPVFSVGSAAPLKTKAFQFGGSKLAAPVSSQDSSAPETVKSSATIDSGPQKPAVFAFGASPSSKLDVISSAGGILFGASTVTPPTAAADAATNVKPKQPAVTESASIPAAFSFGASAKSDNKPATGGFLFKSSADEKTPSEVSFGGFKMQSSVAPAVTSSSTGFTFGSSTVPSTGGFVFGATTTTVAVTAPISSSQVSGSFGNPFKPTLVSWTCTKCQLKNEGSKTMCSSCNSMKGLSPDKKKATTGFGDQFKPEQGTWECASCMVRNTSNSARCAACETPRPTQEKPTIRFSNDLSSTPTATNTSFSGLPTNPLTGSIFQSTWECGSCMVHNTMEKAKCAACETPRLSNSSAPSQDQAAKAPTAAPLFKFGASAPTSGASFTFGAAPSAGPSEAAKMEPAKTSITEPLPSYQKPSLFTFGAAAKTETKSTGGFAFKSSSEAKPATVQPQVGFGGFKMMSSAGSNDMSSASAPGFKLGSSAAPTPSAGGFVFGNTTKTDTVPMSTAQFSFSGQPKPSSFTCFQTSAPAVTTSATAFSFVGNTANSSTASAFNSPSIGGFSFAPKTQPSTLNPLTAPPAFGTPAAQPVFGANTMTPAFGSTASTPAFGGATGTPTFGSVPAPKTASTGGFNFAPQSSDVFPSFGTLAEKKPAMTPPQATGFNFMPAQFEGGNTFSPNFSMNAPPTFNFGATSTPTNQPFQFAASAEVNPAPSPGTQPRKIRKAIRRGRKPV